MAEKSPTIDELFATVQLSDPLKTYKENIDTIKNLVEISMLALVKRTADILESIKSIEQQKKTQIEKLTEDTEQLKKYQEGQKEIIQTTRQLISARKDLIATLDSVRETRQEQYMSSSESSKIELPALMQMAFIYLVTVWDAFILDTVRAILRIHPEFISKSENKIDLTKSDLWFFGSTEELREFLIELEIRRLDGDRIKLVETFNSYWGIDWGESDIPMDTIVEIRARRDLWVHNRGRVNNQYIQMVRKQTPFSLGQIAEIDSKYFSASLFALTQLTVNIHRIADEKHYSKST